MYTGILIIFLFANKEIFKLSKCITAFFLANQF